MCSISNSQACRTVTLYRIARPASVSSFETCQHSFSQPDLLVVSRQAPKLLLASPRDMPCVSGKELVSCVRCWSWLRCPSHSMLAETEVCLTYPSHVLPCSAAAARPGSFATRALSPSHPRRDFVSGIQVAPQSCADLSGVDPVCCSVGSC